MSNNVDSEQDMVALAVSSDAGCVSQKINDLSFVSMSNMTAKMSLVKLIKGSEGDTK